MFPSFIPSFGASRLLSLAQYLSYSLRLPPRYLWLPVLPPTLLPLLISTPSSLSLSQSFTRCFSCLGVDSAGASRRSFPQLTGGDREQTEEKQVDGGWEAEGGRGRRGGGQVDSSDMNNEKQTRRDGRRRGRWRGGMSLCGAIQKPRAIVEEEDDWRWKTGWRRGEVEGR